MSSIATASDVCSCLKEYHIIEIGETMAEAAAAAAAATAVMVMVMVMSMFVMFLQPTGRHVSCVVRVSRPFHVAKLEERKERKERREKNK